jgi:hypothetical protein
MAIKKEKLSWNDIEEMCRDISSKIRKKRIKPDIMVAVSRGGLIPGRIMSSYLKNRNLSVIRVQFYARQGERAKKPIIVEETNSNVKGRTLLVIDDVLETGKTLELVRDYFNDKGAKKVYLAVLIKKNKKQRLKPDFYSRTSDKWIVYPWERFDGSDEI